MLRYSDRARIGYGFLYRHYNDIDVYVEDASCIALWENLLNIIIGGRCRLTRVIQLGGKASVLHACRNDQGASARPRLYVIDGDFDVWRGRRKANLKHLYRINAYCVENLIIGQSALIEVLRDANPNKTANDIRDILAYDEFLADSAKLASLFSLYASIFVLGIPVQTVSFSVHRLLDSPARPNRISNSLLCAKMQELEAEILRKTTSIALMAASEAIDKRVRAGKLPPERHVSGKHYLFPMLYVRSKATLGYRESIETLKARLARHYDVRAEPGLKRAIERLLR